MPTSVKLASIISSRAILLSCTSANSPYLEIQFKIWIGFGPLGSNADRIRHQGQGRGRSPAKRNKSVKCEFDELLMVQFEIPSVVPTSSLPSSASLESLVFLPLAGEKASDGARVEQERRACARAQSAAAAAAGLVWAARKINSSSSSVASA